MVAGLLLALPAGAQAANTYVDEDRPDNSGPCTTPATACHDVIGNAASGALFKAAAGDTIFIDGGTYDTESIYLRDGKSLVYQEFNAPDPPAVIDGGAIYPGISVNAPESAGTIEGLTIRGSPGAIVAEGSVTIRGNVIDGDVAEDPLSTSVDDGSINLYGSGSSNFVVEGNTITDPTVTDGQLGIQARLGGASKATIRGNGFNGFWRAIDLAGNPSLSYSTSTHVIDGNTFTGMHQIPDPDMSDGDDGPIPGIALFMEGGATNLTGNTAGSPGVGTIFGYSTFGGTSVTSARNEAYNLDYGFDFSDAPSLTMNGDVAAHNSVIGIQSIDYASGPAGDLDARNITSWANGTDLNVIDGALDLTSSIVEDPIATNGGCSIAFSRGPTTSGSACETFQTAADPGFVNPTTGINNFHLAAGSPMIDAGSTIAPVPGTLDVDGDPRAVAGTCGGTARADMGADEFVPNCAPPPPGPTPTPPAKKKCKKAKKKSAAAAKKCKPKRRR